MALRGGGATPATMSSTTHGSSTLVTPRLLAVLTGATFLQTTLQGGLPETALPFGECRQGKMSSSRRVRGRNGTFLPSLQVATVSYGRGGQRTMRFSLFTRNL